MTVPVRGEQVRDGRAADDDLLHARSRALARGPQLADAPPVAPFKCGTPLAPGAVISRTGSPSISRCATSVTRIRSVAPVAPAMAAAARSASVLFWPASVGQRVTR